MSTLPGQSGCPVMSEEKIIAVHCACANNKRFNVGRLITAEMISTLLEWNK